MPDATQPQIVAGKVVPQKWPVYCGQERFASLVEMAKASAKLQVGTLCLLKACDMERYFYVPSSVYNTMRDRGEVSHFDLLYIITYFGR